MVIVNIKCGLGNQMFQYAMDYSVCQRKRCTLKLDISWFNWQQCGQRVYGLNLFKVSEKLSSRKEVQEYRYQQETLFYKFFRKLTRRPKKSSKNYYREAQHNFDEGVFEADEPVYFDGYWQSEKYFLQYTRTRPCISMQTLNHRTETDGKPDEH